MEEKKVFQITEVARVCHMERTQIQKWIEEEWIHPAGPESQSLDQEDLARIRLIADLRGDLGVNDEAVPIILHLLDQIHYLRNHISR
jgi:chaperone modulatory protein CbpM